MLKCVVAVLLASGVQSLQVAPSVHRTSTASVQRFAPLRCAQSPPELDDVTKKYGLEAGLFSAGKRAASAEGEEERAGAMAKAGDLLKRYGGAYLLTSTSLAVVSFSFCYFAVSNGIDIAALLSRVGIETSSTSETVGTVGLAYAIHKAASPIRFPPTVALTPIVAKRVFGKTEEELDAAEQQQQQQQ